MKSAPTKNNPWAALDALMKTEPEPTGPEWFTLRAFAARYRMSIPGAHQRLAKLKAAGRVKLWKGITADTRRLTTKWSLT